MALLMVNKSFDLFLFIGHKYEQLLGCQLGKNNSAIKAAVINVSKPLINAHGFSLFNNVV